MTLEAWVDPATTTAAWRDVIYKGNDNYYLEGTSDQGGKPGAGGTFGGTVYGSSALPVNTWTHLAVTYDKTTVRLYVNGTQVSHSGRDRRDRQLDQPALDRQRRHLRPVLQRPDRRRPRLQHRPHRRPDPNRHDHPGRTAGPDTTPPSAPGTLTATAISSSRVDLSWGAASDNVGVTGYHIERCQGAGCTSFTEIGTSTTTSYSDTSAAAGTSYSYRVRANDAAGNLGPYSNTATATTPALTRHRPRRRAR